LIQYLLYQNTKLQTKVAKLENTIITKKRKLILDWLHSSANTTPSIHFQDWTKTIRVCFDDLDAVFEHDLTSGMKHCLTTYFAKETSTLPICSFKQKHGTIYVWFQVINQEGTAENKWTILSFEDFDKWMNQLAHRFLQEFILWKNVHADQMRKNEEGKDKLIEYMRKINGLGESYEQRRRAELKKWLYDKLAKDFTNMVEYEYF
jgi:hypothetical protein